MFAINRLLLINLFTDFNCEFPREQFISLFQVGQASGRTSPEDILRFAALSGYELTDEDKKTFGITDKSQQPSADLD